MLVAYVRLSRRISAFLVDAFVLSLGFYAAIVALTNLRPPMAEIATLVLLFVTLSIEPWLIAKTGASFGHHIYGLKVRRLDQDKPLGLRRSYLRYGAKVLLGWMSVVSILITKRYQSPQDLVVGSLVVHKHPDLAQPEALLYERLDDRHLFSYPSLARNLSMAVFYLVLGYCLAWCLKLWVISDFCIQQDLCSRNELKLDRLINIGFDLYFLATLILMLQHRLWGARKHAK